MSTDAGESEQLLQQQLRQISRWTQRGGSACRPLSPRKLAQSCLVSRFVINLRIFHRAAGTVGRARYELIELRRFLSSIDHHRRGHSSHRRTSLISLAPADVCAAAVDQANVCMNRAIRQLLSTAESPAAWGNRAVYTMKCAALIHY